MSELRKIIEIDAPARAVFNALTDQKELTQWWPDIGTFEPRVGGKFHFTFLAERHKEMGDKDHRLDGEVLEIVPNKKLVYTFIPDEEYRPDGVRPKPTVVTWSLEEVGKNRTKVTLVHSGFTKEMDKHFKDVTAGWSYFTARLVEYCKNKK
ncbi:MAG: SRPBCC family protein [Nitrososphaera sp.]